MKSLNRLEENLIVKKENRMGKRKWDEMLSDLQGKVRAAKRVGPDARADLMDAMASVVHVIQDTGKDSLVRWPREHKLVLV